VIVPVSTSHWVRWRILIWAAHTRSRATPSKPAPLIRIIPFSTETRLCHRRSTPRLSHDIDEVVRKALEKSPDKRFASAAEMRVRLYSPRVAAAPA
jgi:hypothetical protein